VTSTLEVFVGINLLYFSSTYVSCVINQELGSDSKSEARAMLWAAPFDLRKRKVKNKRLLRLWNYESTFPMMLPYKKL